MNNHRFQLEKYKSGSSRYTCPSCGGRREFSRYIDTVTGEYVHDTVGRCNRLDSCGYHYPPREYFKNNGIDLGNIPANQQVISERSIEPPSLVDPDILIKSLACYEVNNFTQFLVNTFGKEKATEAVERYYIGTSKKWQGATVFWQIDIHGSIRTGKIMLYEPTTGERIKKVGSYISWVHSECGLDNFNLVQCLFGEHLLTDDFQKPVAIVQSDKTVVIASLLLPDILWLATGGKEGLNEAKAKVLKGRDVMLFPDAGCYDKWRKIADRLKHVCNIGISGVLEYNITEAEKINGYDIADYMLVQYKAGVHVHVQDEREQCEQM